MYVALGWPYGGRKVHSGSVLYITCEGRKGSLRRLAAFKKVKPADYTQKVPFYVMPTNLCLPKQGLDLIGAMKVQFSSDPPVMIIIDTE